MVRRSPLLALLLVAIHLLSLSVVWSIGLPFALHLVLKLAILLSLLWSLHSAGWLGASLQTFRLRLTPSRDNDAPDRIDIDYPSGRRISGSVVEGSIVLPHLVILRCRPDGARWWQASRNWLLLPDSVAPDDYRRLRIRLRWGRAAPV
ncbi:MAG: hypothetical protein SF172_14655 [Burkholderiales bacterium]|nr:hypothetical protein [Burkholderiales bacterium]